MLKEYASLNKSKDKCLYFEDVRELLLKVDPSLTRE